MWRKGHDLRIGAEIGGGEPVIAFRQGDDRAALRRLVCEGRKQHRFRQLLFADTPPTGANSSAMRLPKVMVPVLSSSSVSTVARCFHCAARGGDHIEADQPIHSGDADRRQQSADRRRIWQTSKAIRTVTDSVAPE